MQQKMPWISPTRLHALFLDRARYCITPHRNFDGPCQCCRCCQFLPVWEGEATGLDGSTTGVWLWLRGSLAVALIRKWCLGGSLAPCHATQYLHPPYSLCLVLVQVPVSESSSRDGASIHTIPSPRPDPVERVLSW